MSSHHVTVDADRIITGVEAVLAGAALNTTAAHLGIDPTDLADAMDTYRAAGLAALQHNQEQTWFQVRIALPDWTTAEATFATTIAPLLDQLDHGHAAWWFLRKYPYWRLRIRTTDRPTIEALLDAFVAESTIEDWWPGIYEPETAAFGGPTTMDIVHNLFCADSRSVLHYARQATPAMGRRELSLLLIRALHHHAGLDWFEAGDVFDRVARMRPAPAAADTNRVSTLTSQLGTLLATPVDAHAALFAPGGPATHAAPWLGAFVQTGKRLHDAATAGTLHRGLRAVLAHIVIFHWNRLGLSAPAQGILAHAARAAILPRS